MHGKTLIYRVANARPEAQDWTDATPDLQFLQQAVGGYIERVPFLQTIELDGNVVPCEVYCDEEGKLKGKPPNIAATELWHKALLRQTTNTGLKPFPTGLYRGDSLGDILSGDVVVVTGDEAFMQRHIEGDEEG